jgi:hypothetical protein
MKDAPICCVVDTNVAVTANGANSAASPACAAASARALQGVTVGGRVFIDTGGRIVAEYRSNLSASGQPGVGDLFFKWLLTHEWGEEKVVRVDITSQNRDDDDFAELPKPPRGVSYDRSDRKFLAVAAAHPDRPPILQSFDTKWWGWRDALSTHSRT